VLAASEAEGLLLIKLFADNIDFANDNLVLKGGLKFVLLFLGICLAPSNEKLAVISTFDNSIYVSDEISMDVLTWSDIEVAAKAKGVTSAEARVINFNDFMSFPCVLRDFSSEQKPKD